MNAGSRSQRDLRRLKWAILGLTALALTAIEAFYYFIRDVPLIEDLFDWLIGMVVASVLIEVAFRGVASLQDRLQQEITKRVQAENARLFESERQRAAELARLNNLIAALAQVAIHIETAADPDGVMETLGTELKQIGINCLVALLDPDGDALVGRYISIESKRLAQAEKLLGFKIRGYRSPVEHLRVYAEIVEHKRPVFVPDATSVMAELLPGLLSPVREHLLRLESVPPGTPAFCLPLVVKDRVVGILNLWSDDLQEADLPAFSAFASQIAIAIENARLYEEVHQTVKELGLLLDTVTAVSSTLDLDRVLLILAEKMAISVEATFCRIALLDETRQALTIRAASPIRALDWDPGLGRQFALADAPWHAEAIERGEAVVLRQDDPSKAVSEAECRIALSEGINSALLIPLMIRDRILGVASLGEMRRWERTPFTADRVRLCQAMADQAAIAIENARLYEQVQYHAAELEQRAAQLYESEARYRTLVEQIPAVTYIAALDEVSTTLYASPQIEPMLGFSPAEWMADPELWLRQLHPDDRQRVLAKWTHSRTSGEPFRSEYRLLSHDGRVVWVRDEAVRVLDEAGQPLFAQGIMLDITARKGEELAITEERARIARDLHDGIIQELSSLGLGLDFCIKEVERDSATVRQELAKIRELLRHNVHELRHIILALRPVELEKKGLVPALKHYVCEWGERSGIQTHVSVAGQRIELPLEVEMTLLRLVQESLNNVRKHAAAHQVWVTLDTSLPTAVSLTVRDDGRGFDLSSTAARGLGLGLRQMHERARAAGGQLEIHAAPGEGAEVRFILPRGSQRGTRNEVTGGTHEPSET